MRRLASAVIVIVLAGCLNELDPRAPPGAAPAPREADASAATYAWGLTRCSYVIATLFVPKESVEDRVPYGFTHPPSGIPGPTAESMVRLDLDAYQCEVGVGLEGDVRNLQYGSFYIPVIPPAKLELDGADAYFLKWDTLIPDLDRREVFSAAGLPVHDGSATVSIEGSLVSARLQLEGAGGFLLMGTTSPPEPAQAPMPFAEYTPLESGGLAQWRARLHDATFSTGAGTVELPEGSWVRRAVGTDKAAVTFTAGTWNLDEASVTFPLGWP